MQPTAPLIFFATHLRNDAWCLDKYLESLLSLDYPRFLIYPYFLVNDSQDGTLSKLRKFMEDHGGEYWDCGLSVQNYQVPDDQWTHAHAAKLNNHIRMQFLESGCDYWLRVDPDLPCRPDTLRRLMRHREGYVAGTWGLAFMSNAQKRDARDGEYRWLTWAELEAVADGELFEADWAGGVALIRRDVAEVCQYRVTETGRDDTLGFCQEAQRRGHKIWVDPSVYLEHDLGL